jgi:hypothetical protein
MQTLIEGQSYCCRAKHAHTQTLYQLHQSSIVSTQRVGVCRTCGYLT